VQAGEIVVARLKGGPTLVRCLASPTPDAKGGGRVRVSVGRNREAQLPGSRIVLAGREIETRDIDVDALYDTVMKPGAR